MTDKNIYKAAIIMSALCAAQSVRAQLHESINVEGKYVPEIIRVDRVNTFPKAMKFSMAASPIDYESGGVAAAFASSLIAMPATGWRDSRTVDDNRGYLELGAGSWLNSTLSAGYRFVDNSSTLAGVRIQHNSTSLWKPHTCVATADVKQYRYDESVGFYATHLVKGKGRFDASADYHAGIFDYYGISSGYSLTEDMMKAPSQTLNDFALRLGWSSILTPGSTLAYDASARVRHFAYRALPVPRQWNREGGKGNRETDVELRAGVRMPWDNGSTVGLDGRLNVLLYSGGANVLSDLPQTSPEDTRTFSIPRPDNYGMMTLTPFYRFSKDLLDVRLGADIDLAFRIGPDGNRYPFFHIAPDVKFALQTGQFGMYLNLLGGSELNTLAGLWQSDYYQMPVLTTTRPTYTPLDASFGINLGPFAGFSVGVEAKFRSSKNVRLGGWYQAWLNYGSHPMPGLSLPEGFTDSDKVLYALDREGLDISGARLGAFISYTPSDAVSFRAEGSCGPRKSNGNGYFNGYDRPKVTASADLTVKPIAPLSISANYSFRGDRAVFTRPERSLGATIIDGGFGSRELCQYSLRDLSLLSLGASWSFTDRFSVWLQGDNILNRHDETLPCLPMQGISVVAGLKVLF